MRPNSSGARTFSSKRKFSRWRRRNAGERCSKAWPRSVTKFRREWRRRGLMADEWSFARPPTLVTESNFPADPRPIGQFPLKLVEDKYGTAGDNDVVTTPRHLNR